MTEDEQGNGESEEERTPEQAAEERIRDIREDMAALQTAEAEVGVLQHKMRQEVMPLDALISEIRSEVEDIEDDEFLTGEEEAEALRSSPDPDGLPDALDLDDVASMGDFKEQLEEQMPGLDFSGEASSTLEQVAEVLTDHLAGRQKFWQDRAERKRNEIQSLRSSVDEGKRKLRKFVNRHEGELDTVPDVDAIEPLSEGEDEGEDA